MLQAQSTTKDYIRAEGDFHKETCSWRTYKAEIGQEEQSESWELSGEFMEWNTVERAIKTEIDTRKNRIKKSGQAQLVYTKNINRNIPTTWRWALWDYMKHITSWRKSWNHVSKTLNRIQPRANTTRSVINTHEYLHFVCLQLIKNYCLPQLVSRYSRMFLLEK